MSPLKILSPEGNARSAHMASSFAPKVTLEILDFRLQTLKNFIIRLVQIWSTFRSRFTLESYLDLVLLITIMVIFDFLHRLLLMSRYWIYHFAKSDVKINHVTKHHKPHDQHIHQDMPHTNDWFPVILIRPKRM